MLFLSSCSFSFDGLPFHTAKSILAAQFHIGTQVSHLGRNRGCQNQTVSPVSSHAHMSQLFKGLVHLYYKKYIYFLTYTSWFVGMKIVYIPRFSRISAANSAVEVKRMYVWCSQHSEITFERKINSSVSFQKMCLHDSIIYNLAVSSFHWDYF